MWGHDKCFKGLLIIYMLLAGGLRTHDMCDWMMELFDQTNLITSIIEILSKSFFITLVRSITMFYGITIILHNILHIQTECEVYCVEYCRSHITLIWM